MKLPFKIVPFITGLPMFVLLLVISPSMAQDSVQSLHGTIKSARTQGIQNEEIDKLIQRAREKEVSDQDIAGILQPAVETATEHFPYNLVINKSLEGIAKDVQPNVIIKTENKLQNNVRIAAKMTDEWIKNPTIQDLIGRNGQTGSDNTFRNQVLKSAARAMFQGVPTNELRQLFTDMAQGETAAHMYPKQVSVAIGVLPDLPTTKNHPDVSRAIILQSIKRHFTSSQIQQLPSAMIRAEQMGQLPAEAISNNMKNQMTQGEVAMTILQGLFDSNGNFKGGPPTGIPPGLNNPHAPGSHGNSHGMNNGNGHSGSH